MKKIAQVAHFTAGAMQASGWLESELERNAQRA